MTENPLHYHRIHVQCKDRQAQKLINFQNDSQDSYQHISTIVSMITSTHGKLENPWKITGFCHIDTTCGFWTSPARDCREHGSLPWRSSLRVKAKTKNWRAAARGLPWSWPNFGLDHSEEPEISRIIMKVTICHHPTIQPSNTRCFCFHILFTEIVSRFRGHPLRRSAQRGGGRRTSRSNVWEAATVNHRNHMGGHTCQDC